MRHAPTIVDGRKMPMLSGFREGDKYWLVADHRFACGPFDEAQAHQAARLAAQCMAVMSGYAHLGAEHKHDWPFGPVMKQMDDLPEKSQ